MYLDGALSSLADPTRRAIIEMLAGGPRPAGQLGATFHLTQPAVSKHLRVLRESGLVETTGDPSDARVRVYRLREDRLEELHAWLGRIREHWRVQLESFREYAERSRGTPSKHGRERKR